MSYRYFQNFNFFWIHGHRPVPGGLDGATVSMFSLEHLITALLLIIDELCPQFRIPLSSALLCAITNPT
jgi:hypothetical protein